MRFDVINKLKKEKRYTNEELANISGVPKATIDKITSGKTSSPNFDTVDAIASALGCSTDVFRACDKSCESGISDEAMELAKKFDALDERGKQLLRLVMNEEVSHSAKKKIVPIERAAAYHAEKKIIPLYCTSAAAGYASPAMSDEHDDYEVDISSAADFAVRISGDSMEPFIEDGAVVLVKRQSNIKVGEVGMFFVDGDMKCKQYYEDGCGNASLLSLNRNRADADVILDSSSGVTVTCYGKVILPKNPPLPKM